MSLFGKLRVQHKLLQLRERLQTSIWFIPLLFCLGCLAFALGLFRLERDLDLLFPRFNIFAMSVTSARNVLGVIAGSVLSVGGVVFSVTMVALTLTSGQYGPKILRQFLSDRDSKISLGLFLGTSLYCLVIMASYGDTDRPSITVIAALLLVIIALAGFIRFIHGTATDLQADQIIERIGSELHQSLQELSGSDSLQGRSQDTLLWRRRARGQRPAVIAARASGYVQTIDYAAIVSWCTAHNCVAQLRVRPGDFLLQGTTLVKLYGCQGELADSGVDPLRALIRTGPMRTPVQDPEYPITQLNQLAARALSPGINDPGTAITCIDWYSMALARIVDRELPGKVFLDEEGGAVLLVRFSDFAGIAKAFYAPARQFARDNIPVVIALLESLIRLASLTTRADRLQQLEVEASLISVAIEQGDHLEYDLDNFRRRYQQLKRLTRRLQNSA
jgi:uncharacterized membrane protein